MAGKTKVYGASKKAKAKASQKRASASPRPSAPAKRRSAARPQKKSGGTKRRAGVGETLKGMLIGAGKLALFVVPGVAIAEGARAFLTAPKKDGTQSWFAENEAKNPATQVMGALATGLPGALAGAAIWYGGKRFNSPLAKKIGQGTVIGAAVMTGVRVVIAQPAVAVRTRLQIVDKSPAQQQAQLAAAKAGNGAGAAGAAQFQAGNATMIPGAQSVVNAASGAGGPVGDMPLLPAYQTLQDSWADPPRSGAVGDAWQQTDPRQGMGDSSNSAWAEMHNR